MKSRHFIGSACALISLGLAPVLAVASPDDQLISFKIYNDPNTPSLGLRYEVFFDLSAVDEDSKSVGWQINEIAFRRYDSYGHVENEWSEVLPEVLTADGLWWVDHASVEEPVLSEFVLPPAVYGTAAVSLGTAGDLSYSLEGQVYEAAPGGPPFPLTAAIDIYAQEDEIPEPDLDDEEEPVEPKIV